MKTFGKTAIALLVILTLSSIAIAYVQRGYAQEALQEALRQRELAEENMMMAREAEKRAIEMAAEARMVENQNMKLRKQIEECKNQ